jgi:ketosteroid isomerase-like protein
MTAEEFFEQHIQRGVNNTHTNYLNTAIEFAKYHVEQALKEASKKADTDGRHTYLFRREYAPVKVDKNSILNAYPLTNIE